MDSTTRKTLVEQAESLRNKRQFYKQLEGESKTIQAEVIAVLDQEEQKSFRYETDDGRPVTMTRVQAEKMHIKEKGLKKALGAKAWAKVTKRVLDEDKLMAQIQDEKIDVTTVAKHTEYIPNRPFVRFTVRAKTKASVAAQVRRGGG